MNDLIAYSFKDQVLRTQFNEEGEPLFCLADVCEVLELTNPSSVANSIKEEFSIPKLNLGVITRPDNSSIEVNFITEPQGELRSSKGIPTWNLGMLIEGSKILLYPSLNYLS